MSIKSDMERQHKMGENPAIYDTLTPMVIRTVSKVIN